MAIDMSLDRVRALMKALGDPQDALAPVIHVAGTNGKGSTIAYLRAMLESAGKRVHVYTSPHLVSFNERIRIAGALIDDRGLAAILEEIERINAGAPITFFEITTAAAFLAFARTKADFVLLETGMGGRLDATNLVRKPVAIALAPISFDHMQYLGDTLALIAGEKAGIMKPGVPTAVGVQPPEAAAVFDARGDELPAPLFRHGREWNISPTGRGLHYAGRAVHDLPFPVLPGPHQYANAGLAVAVAEVLGLDANAMAAGMREAQWPARLQKLTRGPLAGALPAGVPLFLDGGHNDAAGEALAGWIGNRTIDLVFGMLSTKEPASFLRHVAPRVRRLRAIPIVGEPLSRPASEIAAAARSVGIADVAESADENAAIVSLAAAAEPAVPVLVCGSLYLCGRVLAANG
ncbi:MAG: bifunctional folylpolyglutamate synthase/dihydrofolate synthase [Alphaproteobacteria bacterium]|nr:bifunctional folylpolyglutamate synthase/dihydrofolate synthase [Alphaproteobacteria bacterium]